MAWYRSTDSGGAGDPPNREKRGDEMFFVGNFRQSVDGKRRVSVPSSFRRALGEDACFYAFKPLSEGLRLRGVVDCRTLPEMLKLQGMVDELDPLSDDQEALKTAIFGNAHELRADKSGRIVLPERLVEYAGIADECAFVGGGSSFQLFNPEAYETYRPEVEPKAASARKALGRISRGTPDPALGPAVGA